MAKTEEEVEKEKEEKKYRVYKIGKLEKQLLDLKHSNWTDPVIWKRRTLAVGAACVGILVAYGVYLYLDSTTPMANKRLLIGMVAVGLFGLISFLSYHLASVNLKVELSQKEEYENDLDLLNISNTSWETKAIKLFKYHQFEVKKYYDLTLQQSSWIFRAGIVIIIIGFGFVAYTLYAIAHCGKDDDQRAVIGIVGSLATFMANFIGVIYLRMYTETVKSLTVFHNKLVTTHHLHFANYLNSKINDEDLRNKSLAEITKKIVEE